MSIAMIRKFLRRELKVQLVNDVKPIIFVKAESGFFGVPKQLMTFVDFLGTLRRGVTIKQRRRKKVKILATSQKAIAYIKGVLGKIDDGYLNNADTLYEMYRHGLIHLYQPKDLKIRNRIVSWVPYKGRRTDRIMVKTGKNDFPLTVRHLKIVPHPTAKDRDLLPICINCLYSDVYKSVEIFLQEIVKYNKYRTRWVNTVNLLLKPKEM